MKQSTLFLRFRHRYPPREPAPYIPPIQPQPIRHYEDVAPPGTEQPPVPGLEASPKHEERQNRSVSRDKTPMHRNKSPHRDRSPHKDKREDVNEKNSHSSPKKSRRTPDKNKRRRRGETSDKEERHDSDDERSRRRREKKKKKEQKETERKEREKKRKEKKEKRELDKLKRAEDLKNKVLHFLALQYNIIKTLFT